MLSISFLIIEIQEVLKIINFENYPIAQKPRQL